MASRCHSLPWAPVEQWVGLASGVERQEKGASYLDVSVLGPEGVLPGQPAAGFKYHSNTFLGPSTLIC